jgi:hypothetical protein
VHKALGGKPGKATLQEARNLRLVDLQNTGGTHLGEPARADRFGYANCKTRFRQPLLWLR